MTSLLKRIEKRMADPKLNANFNREVSKGGTTLKITEGLNPDERNELYTNKLNQRSMIELDNEILDFENVEEFKAFVKDRYYSDTILMFDYNELVFPNTYVLIELPYETIDNNGEDDVWVREQTRLEILTLKGFKKLLIKNISEFK